MKKTLTSVTLLAASLVLAGCSGSGLLGGSRGPTASNVPSNGNLALPPDLSLPQPGTGTAASYQAPAPSPSLAQDGMYDTAAAVPAAPRRTVGGTRCSDGSQAVDIYACYNINKQKADGSQKSPFELQGELRTAIVAEKRRTNPGYGTIRNFGDLFN
jgi:hypothetical protein